MEQKDSFTILNNILVGKQIDCKYLDNVHIGKVILNTLKSNPNFVAQVNAETGQKITFEQIRNKSVKLAIWMKNEDILPGDLVGICTTHYVGMYALLACLYIGAVPIIRKYDQRTDCDVSYDFVRINPKIIFIDEIQKKSKSTYNDKTNDMLMVPTVTVLDSSKVLLNKISFTYKFLAKCIDKFYNEQEVDKFTCTKLNMFRLQTAMIMYTRGTNGLTKAVKIPHKAIIAPVNQEVIAILPGSVGMYVGSLFLFPNMILAIQSILMHKQIIKFEGNNMIKLWAAIEKYKVNWVRLETHLSQAILDSKDLLKFDISSLKVLMFSGSGLQYSIHIDLNMLLPKTSVVSLYGTMETGIIAYQRCTGKPGSNGYVGRNVQLMIVGVSGLPLDSNTPGKIWCKCWGMSNKYYDINGIVPTKIINRNGWYYTGDIGYYDNDGDIYVINRATNFIHFNEFYFSPTIIENLIKSQSGVNEVAIVAKSDDIYKEVPVAFITIKPGQQVNQQEIKEITVNNLWNCMWVRHVIVLDKIPCKFDGNIDRKCLRHMAARII